MSTQVSTQMQQSTPSTKLLAPSPIRITSLLQFLQSYTESVAIKINHAGLYHTKIASFALCFGPLIVKRFSQNLCEIYKVSSDREYGLSLVVQLPWNYLGRIALVIFISIGPRRGQGLSMQWNLSFPRVVPFSAPIMKMAYNGDIVGMENLFMAGKASPTDVRPDGTGLLHVGISSIRKFFKSPTHSLQVAARVNSFELVEYLLNKGLCANKANDEGV